MARRRIVEHCLAIDIQSVCYLSEGPHDVFVCEPIQQRVHVIQPLHIVRIGTQDVKITQTLVGFGTRKWFVCPKCQTNAKKLFLTTDCTKWLCRQCNNLTYLSSNINKNEMRKLTLAIEQQQKELEVTKQNGYLLTTLAPFYVPIFKPLYMQQVTFDIKRTRLDLMIIRLAELRFAPLKHHYKRHFLKR